MGTTLTPNSINIFDDIVLDYCEKLRPKTKKVLKLVAKVRISEHHDKWRAFLIMYEAFKNFGWLPEKSIVIDECEFALRNLGDDWNNKENVIERIRLMRDEMLNPFNNRKKCKGRTHYGKETVWINETATCCRKCEPSLQCPACEAPYEKKEIVLQMDGVEFDRKSNVPCSVCHGTHFAKTSEIKQYMDYLEAQNLIDQ